ncbi:hypothetical protein ABE65_010290 [Fictibacillus phosphorivorans]|uniref:Uncharacterized protein n=1 Tax=Fictibacillus phosphorivorans TaxID=1221500 RepID=A0A160ILK9_9BACL|nr:hypothetical protein [Fictibacillus phosphorivorans]ANC77168.1 hypothetical protein ABE65_010290 [Fictibacillus phosphorivorans]
MKDNDETINIQKSHFKFLKNQTDKHDRLQKLLLEYMGYSDEFLITKSALQRLKRSDLSEIVLEQRAMIRKLIDDLEPSKRKEHLEYLDKLYMLQSRT